MKIYKRETLLSWFTLFKRFLCVLMRGHKFPPLGRRSDLICLRCGVIFFTKKNYKKGKFRK